MSDSKISFPAFNGEPLAFRPWKAKLIATLLTYKVCHFFMTKEQLFVAVPDRTKRTPFIVLGARGAEGDILSDKMPEIKYDDDGKTDDKSLHENKAWTKQSDAATAIATAIRNSFSEDMLLRIRGAQGDHTALDHKELYTNIMEAFDALTPKEINILKGRTRTIDPTKSMRSNILVHDDAFRQLKEAGREQPDPDQRDNLIHLLRATKYDSAANNWLSMFKGPGRTYKSLCDHIIQAEEDDAVHTSAPHAVHNAARSAATTDPIQALQAQVINLTSMVASALAGSRGPSPVTTATPQTRHAVPRAAPEGKPHWCPTHHWNSTHAGAQCTKPGKFHATDVTPAACEARKAKAATDRGITTIA